MQSQQFDYRTSSACGGPCSDGCVEVATNVPGTVSVRDAQGNTVFFTDAEWNDFLPGVKAGEFDRLLEENGAESNAATWVDWTYYYESLPADRFPLAVKLESERMGRLVLREPQVAIDIESYRPFFIMGEVTAPGQYPYVAGLTVESAIAIAGGFLLLCAVGPGAWALDAIRPQALDRPDQDPGRAARPDAA